MGCGIWYGLVQLTVNVCFLSVSLGSVLLLCLFSPAILFLVQQLCLQVRVCHREQRIETIEKVENFGPHLSRFSLCTHTR